MGTSAESTWQFTYDPDTGMPVQAYDPDDVDTTFNYLPNGRLWKIVAPEDRITTLNSIDAFGNPETVMDPSGTVTTYIYDSHGNLMSSSTPWKTDSGTSLGDAAETIYTRDPAHPDDVMSVKGPDGRTTSFTHAAGSGLVTSVTDPAGGTTKFGYDAVGNRVWTISPEGNKAGANPVGHRGVSVVNAAGEPLATLRANATGSADGFVRYGLSDLGAAATGESWDSVIGAWSVNAGTASAAGAGIATLPTSVTPTDGQLVTSVIPAQMSGSVGVVFRVQGPSDYWAAVDDGGTLRVSKTVAGSTTMVGTVADAGFVAGDRIRVFTTAQNIVVYRNATAKFGLTDSTLGSGSDVGLFAGSAGRVSAGFSVGKLAGEITESFYDAAGRQVASVGPRTAGFNFTATKSSYDHAGNLKTFLDSNGHLSSQDFDAMSRLKSQTDAEQAETTYGHDALGRVNSVQAPGKSAMRIDYVNADPSTSSPATKIVTRPDGVVVTTMFDASDDPVQVSYSDGTPTVTNAFDALGRLKQSSGAVTTTRSYDTLGETLSVTRAGRTVAYGLDRPGKITDVTYPNGQHVTRGYDSVGRWVSVTDWQGKTTSFGYDADGNVTDTAMANGTSTHRDFDGADQVSKVSFGVAGGGTWPISYVRGSGGELVQASQFGSTNAWGYDPAQQVTSATNPSGSFAFDTVGNPTSINGTTQAFDASGEICWADPNGGTGACVSPPVGATSFGFNANGERTSTGADTFGYDANGQMTSATTTAGASSYTYAADGLRTSKVVAGATTTFAWDDTAPVPQLIQDDAQYYVYGPDGLPVERLDADPTHTRSLYIDATGSVVASTDTTDTTGTIVANRSYDPWGNVTGHTGTPVSLGWQHQYQDPETGLYNLWHRYYDPATAQFTTPDPLFSITGDRYGYAGNDPINGSDPTGLWCVVHNDNGGCLGSGVATSVAHGAKEGFTHVVNGASGVDSVALAYGEITSGGHCYPRGGRIECDGAWGAGGRPWTFGDVVMNTSSSRMSDERFGHESKHSTQWAAFGGWGFIPAYLLDLAIEGRCNSFEHGAGYTSGGYNDPPNPCQPGHQSSSPCPAGGHYSTDPH